MAEVKCSRVRFQSGEKECWAAKPRSHKSPDEQSLVYFCVYFPFSLVVLLTELSCRADVTAQCLSQGSGSPIGLTESKRSRRFSISCPVMGLPTDSSRF